MKMRPVMVAVVISIVLIALCPHPAVALSTRVYVDGRIIPLDVPAMIMDGRAMVPARAISEAIGASVHWDPDTTLITISAPGSVITFTPGSAIAYINDALHELDVPVPLLTGRTLIPIRFAGEALGIDITWDTSTRSVRAYTGAEVIVPDQVTLAFVGDVLLGFSSVADAIDRYGVHYPWDHVRPLLTSADYALANLECAVSRRGEPQPGKMWAFRGKPEAIAGMQAAGIDVVSLANNHSLDYGVQAMLDTIMHLNEYGVAAVGAGSNVSEAATPHIWSNGELSVGFLGVCAFYPPGWNATSTSPGVFISHYEHMVMSAVRDLKHKVDIVVVGIHWGEERSGTANQQQQSYGRKLIDNGADLVIGHHPHVLQGIEVYKGGLIAYSLGNFLFTYNLNPDTLDSMILMVTVDQAGVVGAQVIPIIAEPARPRPADPADTARILNKLEQRSHPFGTRFSADGTMIWP